MGLNIKNESVHRLARQVSRVTGESMTGAIEVALQERLRRLNRKTPESLAERLMTIGRDCAPRLARVPDHDSLLYGDDGLPS